MKTRRPLSPTLLQQLRQSRRLQVRSISLTLRLWLTVRNPLRSPNAHSRFTLLLISVLVSVWFPHLLFSSLWFSRSLSPLPCLNKWWEEMFDGRFKEIFILSHTSTAFRLVFFWDLSRACPSNTSSSNQSGPHFLFETPPGCLPAPSVMDWMYWLYLL